MAPVNQPILGPISINKLEVHTPYTVYTGIINHAFTAYFLGFNPENEAVFWFGNDMLARVGDDMSVFYTPDDPTIPPTDEPIRVYDPPPFIHINRFVPENVVNDAVTSNNNQLAQGGNRCMCRKNRTNRKRKGRKSRRNKK